MKSWRIRVLVTALLLSALLAPSLLKAQPAELLQRPEHFERSREYDALHYRLAFVLDFEGKSYRGENTITLAALKDGLAACVLDAEDLTVEGAATPDGAVLPYSYQGGKLVVRLPRPLAYGERTSLVVRFSQKQPKTGMKFIDAAPDHPAQIDTYSWPEDAHHWFPCFDDPVDKVTSEVIATVRADFKVLSNGRRVEVKDDAGGRTKTWHWSQDKPHPAYCIMLAAGPYDVIEDRLGSLPVDYWVYPKDATDAPRSFRKTPRMISFYEKTFGVPYPWAKYDQVCVAGYGGGMEATTATILGQGTIHDERADQDFSSDGLVAHELAHMWWGDFVTERAWRDVWLSESFATYSEYLFSRFDRGEDEGALNLEDKKRSYFNEASRRYIRPVVFNRYRVPWDIMDAHSYPKGAAVLHMLRFILGDQAFFRTLRAFLNRFAYGNADTHDFMTAVKDTTGENLDWFFEQWLMKPGHPVFEVGTTWNADARKFGLRVRQVQDFAAGVPVFRTPVLIGIVTDAGHSTEKIWLDDKDQSFEFTVAEEPRLVRFDEGNFLLKELRSQKSRPELLFQLRRDDAVGRMWAAGELASQAGDAEVREALMASARTDGFWAVRRQALEALAPPSGRTELAAFFRERTTDDNSKVRAAAVRALGTSRDPGLESFYENLYAADSSYLVQAEALTAVGRCGRRVATGFLKKAAGTPSPGNVLKRAADAALKRIGDVVGRGSENPKVLIRTDLGDITIEIFASQAPLTAANFLHYVDAGLYDGTTFFRTVTVDNQPTDKVRIEVVQGGEVDEARAFAPVPHESTEKTELRHVNGTVSMARDAPGSATSSFFICLHNQPELDFGGRRNPDGQGFAAFGKVTAGMDVVKAIQDSPAQGQRLTPPVRIISVRRIGR